MKAFGLELRKVGKMHDLYAEVDVTLSRVPSGGINAEIQTHAIAQALHHMMQPEKYLDVCVIREGAKLTGLHISAERLQVYHLAHCISWNQMDPEYRQLLMAMILDDFRSILCPQEVTLIVT